MQFDPHNHIVMLCASGIALEGDKNEAAQKLYEQAWNEAQTDVEKLIAAHYVARLQNAVTDKLAWDETALKFAMNISSQDVKGWYPSLYLNIAKCHEDLGDRDNARRHYELGYSFACFLPEDGYGKMILSGLVKGMDRVK